MVAQEDSLGCGVACVANLLNISYQEALELFAEPEKVKSRGVYCREIVTALKKIGVVSDFKYLKPRIRRRIYKPGTIVFTTDCKNYPRGHFLLRIQDGWVDPWVNRISNQDATRAQAGFRQRLPGRPIYAIFGALSMECQTYQLATDS